MGESIVIIGAGLCGTMLAVRMAQRGYNVNLYERRGDMRRSGMIEGRSINLALSDRGIQALEMIGMGEIVSSDGIPMRGRKIHSVEGEQGFYPYSGREGEHINSISRGGLNIALLNKAENYENLKIFFNHRCDHIDFASGEVYFTREDENIQISIHANVILGTDGAGSSVRRAMSGLSNQIRFDFSQTYLSHGYKELSIPPAEDGGFRIDKEVLHIWPRGEHMLIALPNLDGSFTVTLFQDFNGEYGLDAMDKDLNLAYEYFEKYYRDALQHMPDFKNDFQSNPSSSLGTVKCFPWAIGGCSLLLGDAAHAIVPFYGQGMNASFEDVYVLDKLMSDGVEDWAKLFREFELSRKPNADAIADLAVDNFYEMRDQSGDPLFQKKAILEKRMENEMPNQYFSKYSMVTFRPDLPYETAMKRGRAQDKILLDFVRENPDVKTVDLERVMKILKSKLDQCKD